METTKIFYKYRRLANTEGNPNELDEHTRKLLEEGELYFASPEEVNDPFDSKISFDENPKDPDLRKYLWKHKSRFFPKSYSQTEKAVAKLRAQSRGIKNLIEEIENDLNLSLRFFCTSAKNDNLLLWSHYADNHKGICIGINSCCCYAEKYYLTVKENQLKPEILSDGTPNKYIQSEKISYSLDRPDPITFKELNLNNEEERIKRMKSHILTKSKDWEYEKEQRFLLFHNEQNGKIKIPLTEIKEIYFGAKADENLISQVCDIVKNYPCKVKLYKYKISTSEYRLIPEEI